MEEDIKTVEELKYQLIMRNREIENDRDNEVLMSFYEERAEQIQAIENLLKGYRELEEENKNLSKDYYDLGSNYCDLDEKCKNSIPISVIQNKMDELENTIDMGEEWYTKQYIIDVLKELLEEE